MKKAQSLGKKAFLNVDTLIIDDNRYTVDDLKQLPKDLDHDIVSTPKIGDNMQAFFGGASPCSNFHSAGFYVKGIYYKWSEQYYVSKKADFAGRPDLVAAVLAAQSPQECFRISLKLNKLIDLDEWHVNHAEGHMYVGVRAKFEHNTSIRKFLINTGERTLVEANPKDKFWSCGHALKETHKILDSDHWPGENRLGRILERVRFELKDM